jgi:hypothetical protein
VVHTVSGRSLNAEVQGQSQASVCVKCGVHIGTGTGFFSSASFCTPFSIISQRPFVHFSVTDAVCTQQLTVSLKLDF